jgi:hypothetical protein
MSNPIFKRQHQQGNVLFLILVAVVLFAGLSFALTGRGGSQTNSIVAERIVAALRGQIDLIRSSFQECALTPPGAGTGANYGLGGLPLGYNGSAYVTTAQPLANTMCDFGNGMVPLFSGARMLGQMPNNFGAWTYTNVGNGSPNGDVFITSTLTAAQSADAGIRQALQQLMRIYSTAEATIVDNGTAATITICLRNGSTNAACGV